MLTGFYYMGNGLTASQGVYIVIHPKEAPPGIQPLKSIYPILWANQSLGKL
jgi:hypothetical protein